MGVMGNTLCGKDGGIKRGRIKHWYGCELITCMSGFWVACGSCNARNRVTCRRCRRVEFLSTSESS